MYKNPLVFFGEDVAMVSLEEEIQGSGKAEELKEKSPLKPKNKKNSMDDCGRCSILNIRFG